MRIVIMDKKKVLFSSLLLFLVIAALVLADVRFDLFGNKIVYDLIAPAGGGSVSDSSGVNITCSNGQCAAGTSQDSSGVIIYHGVYSPAEYNAAGANLILFY